VTTWLLTIARNVAVDVVRLRRHEVVGSDVLLSLQLPSGEPDPDERLIAAGESERVRRAVAILPEEQKRALVLAAFHGLTGREISEMEGIPLGTVKTRIRTAMLKLRSALEVADE
jgi:RNA polymerase sigma-70 factor (ECF subfamily)